MVQTVAAVPDSTFLWFLHQPASFGWLKREVAARRPDLRFAFSRPGLTTFKLTQPSSDQSNPSSFARAFGHSLGRATDVSDALKLADGLGAAPLRLHVFERDPDAPAEERDPKLAGSRARALESELRAAAPSRFLEGLQAAPGDLVLDVITAASEHPADGIFLGWHRSDRSRGPWPGGVPAAVIPPTAPSRAWAKIEEAIAWSGLVPAPGQVAVELGSAPGGASYALLERGLHVHGVDPGAMSPLVLSYVGRGGNRFVHHAKPAAEVDRRELPRRIDWLASDVNLAPMVALKYVERFVALAHGGLRGAFITLKLNDDGVFQALPRLIDRVQRLGARELRITQLPSHRSELVAILTW